MAKYSVNFYRPSDNTYDVIPQIKIVEKLSEELDMYEFTLATLDHKLDLEFRDHNGFIPIFLKINGRVDRIMYLSYYNCTIVAYNPMRYKYVIQAVSPTIALQRIVLPNKLITQKIKGKKKTILEEVTKILEVYAPNIVNMSPEVTTRLNVACPEMQFVKATLHEVLISLFAVVGLIPKLESKTTLDCLDLKGKLTNFALSDFSRVEESNTIANYADNLDYDIENAISKDEDIETTWLAPTSDEAVVSTENYYWKMPSEIYEIESVILSGRNIEFKGASNEWFPLTDETVNITDYVVSKQFYDTLKTTSAIQELGKEFKRNNIYYEGNRIDGASFIESSWLPGTFKQAIINVVFNALKDTLPNVTEVKINNVRQTLMKVKYKTLSENTRVKVIKQGVVNPTNALISNQDESYIDIVNFGSQKQELINRLGNTQTLAQANFDTKNGEFDSIPQIGDILENRYIITEREMLIKENTTLANFVLTKDYVFQTGYSGLKQLKRFTQIDTQRTLIRNDNFLLNFRLDLTNKGSSNNDYLIYHLIDDYGRNTSSDGGITQHYIETYFENGKDSTLLIIESQNKAVADSVVCKIGFQDNYIIGDRIDIDDDAYIKTPVKYTDENGEFRTIRIYFGEAEERKDGDYWVDVSHYPNASFKDASKTHHYNEFLINKDNREITNITLQFRTVGNKEEQTYVYPAFAKWTGLTAHLNTGYKVYVLYNKDPIEGYNENSTTPLGEYYKGARVVFGQTPSGVKERNIVIKNVLFDYGFHAIGVTDSDGNLLFALNYQNIQLANSYVTLWINDIN